MDFAPNSEGPNRRWTWWCSNLRKERHSLHTTQRPRNFNIEWVWVEIRNYLFEHFIVLRIPTTHTFGFAIDTGTSDIIVLGDFILDTNKPNACSKINDICQQYDLQQTIREPTHFTERSSSLIDIILEPLSRSPSDSDVP